MPMLADRVKDTTTTTGTGALTLAGAAPSGFRTFAAAFAVGAAAIAYCIADAATGAWEMGLGTLSAGTTLQRDAVLSSSNAGGLVNFAAGTKDVFCSPAAAVLADGRAVALAGNTVAVGAAEIFTKTITAATTLAVANVPAAGLVGAVVLQLTNGGAYAVTWWSGIKWANATAPALQASGMDTVVVWTIDGGTTWLGVVLPKFA